MWKDKIGRWLRRLKCFCAAFLLLLPTISAPVSALSEPTLDKFADSDIVFYDPEACGSINFGGNSDGSDVYMIGDSITVQSEAELKELMPKIKINAKSGMQFSNYDNDLSLPGGVDHIPQNLARPILVFALGTNGGVNQNDINKLFAALEGKDVKVILMTIYYHNKWEGQMTSANQMVQTVATKYDNISYFDWYKAASASPSKFVNSSDGVHPTAEGRKEFAKTVQTAVNAVTSIGAGGGDAVYATGDYAAIATAKNANVVFEHPYWPSYASERDDGWRVDWDNTNTKKMATFLEKFGDLAYQTGKAAGVPWVFILAQMRYEDKNSACGSYNYWGMRCSGSTYHGPGRADKNLLASGKTVPTNLGEGFALYGRFWHNGYYDSALGITDPKEFYAVAAPIWVGSSHPYQGITASIDALQAFIDSPEGQEIVSQFGNYGGGGVCCLGGSSSPTYQGAAAGVKWENGWIVSGVDGYYKDLLDDLPQQDTWGAAYLTASKSDEHAGNGPNKILLHATEGGSAGKDSVHNIYAGQPSVPSNNGKAVPPHFTVDIKHHKTYQHQSVWVASAAIKGEETGDLIAGVQIEIVGYDTDDGAKGWNLNNDNFSDQDWQYLAKVITAIGAETGVPLTSSVDWSDDDSVRFTNATEFMNYEGILAHKHAYGNDHSDISEQAWQHIDEAIQFVNGGGQCVSGSVATLQATVTKFAWPKYRGRDGEQMPEYSAAVDKANYYTGGCHGNDCGGWVTVLMRESGWDPKYNEGGKNTSSLFSTFTNAKGNSKWQDVTSTIHSNDDAQPGDVILASASVLGHSMGHTLAYVGEIPDFNSVMASASYCSRAPMADSSDDIMDYVRDGYHIFRKTR